MRLAVRPNLDPGGRFSFDFATVVRAVFHLGVGKDNMVAQPSDSRTH